MEQLYKKFTRFISLVLLLLVGLAQISFVPAVSMTAANGKPGGNTMRVSSINDVGLVLHMPFDGNIADVSGSGNNGTASSQSYTADHLGNPNSAYLFNGSNNFITVPNNSSLNPFYKLTITLWLRVDSIQSNYMDVLVKGGPVIGYFENREYGFWTKQNFTFWYPEWKSAGDGSGQHECDGVHHSYSVGNWIFFSSIVDRVNHHMQIYANGVLTEETADSYSSFNANAYSLIIGSSEESYPEHSPLRGAIDDLRIYNRALTQTDIQTLYNGGELPSPPPGMVPLMSPGGFIGLTFFLVLSAGWLMKRNGMRTV